MQSVGQKNIQFGEKISILKFQKTPKDPGFCIRTKHDQVNGLKLFPLRYRDTCTCRYSYWSYKHFHRG